MLEYKEEAHGAALEDFLCFAVYSTEHALTQLYRPLLSGVGLTYPQYLVMTLLWDHDARSVGELGRALQLDTSTLTPMLKRLETMELVRRSRDRRDERVVRVSLTPDGAALREKAREIPSRVRTALDMTESELRALNTQLLTLRDRIRAATD
ncbi:MarR family winged helix-turn-helix transcriptional regulator [Pseudoroseicyclus aestuarii]|uniref:DNA-binding MarR family transcriptional regulator n=1 Tax=Pseudoroseicyclus aestuarii TaxID=1795041 RepID=A0A318SVX5_9RHOB|nr:MarR family transcriptional regulator [Pseudoroseicyclus aestuarii]PYE85585.1 DNA-binding MarR family transcriptional regulator [Pseudoroseicyclus aestuarii]